MEYKRKWCETHPEEIAAYYKKRYENVPKKVAMANKKWRQSNPEKTRAMTARRRAAKVKATPSWVDHKELAKIYAEAVRCGLQVDHIVPIRHPRVCGLHVPWNLQLLTKTQNCRKNNQFNI